MALADLEIWMELESGDLSIDPIDAAAVGPSVVDLRLDSKMRVYRAGSNMGVELRLRDSRGDQLLNYVTDLSEIGPEGVVLRPGDLLIGYTLERIQLPVHLCGWVEGRSGFARLGLAVHNTAPILHAGWGGQIALELTNQGRIPIRLDSGIHICQLVLERLGRPAKRGYGGSHQDQRPA